MVRHHEKLFTGDRNAAVETARGIAHKAPGPGTLEMPDRAPAAGVQRVALVSAGDVHDTFDHHRGCLQSLGAEYGKEPRGRQPRHIVFVDLIERAVTVPAPVTIICE